MLAFDNCQENQSWSQVSALLDELNQASTEPVHFTFFLSAVGLMTDAAKNAYIDPMGREGKANIDFGGKSEDVLKRIAWINKVRAEGNEIASHAVGHFSGKDWTVEQWRHEFEQYDYILNHLIEVNHFTGEQAERAKLSFKPEDLVGFRAPYLDGGERLNTVLEEQHFLYDTSNTDQGENPLSWPRKYAKAPALWNFGLTFITTPIAMPAAHDPKHEKPREVKPSHVIAMDYNWCYRQTGGCPDKDPYAADEDEDAEQVLAGYLTQFAANYNGNRAPLNIGHHFQPYRGGAYNRIFFRFAKAVCGLPEVRCATYSELAAYLQSAGPEAVAQYQSGKFPKGSSIAVNTLFEDVGLGQPSMVTHLNGH